MRFRRPIPFAALRPESRDDDLQDRGKSRRQRNDGVLGNICISASESAARRLSGRPALESDLLHFVAGVANRRRYSLRRQKVVRRIRRRRRRVKFNCPQAPAAHVWSDQRSRADRVRATWRNKRHRTATGGPRSAVVGANVHDRRARRARLQRSIRNRSVTLVATPASDPALRLGEMSTSWSARNQGAATRRRDMRRRIVRTIAAQYRGPDRHLLTAHQRTHAENSRERNISWQDAAASLRRVCGGTEGPGQQRDGNSLDPPHPRCRSSRRTTANRYPECLALPVRHHQREDHRTGIGTGRQSHGPACTKNDAAADLQWSLRLSCSARRAVSQSNDRPPCWRWSPGLGPTKMGQAMKNTGQTQSIGRANRTIKREDQTDNPRIETLARYARGRLARPARARPSGDQARRIRCITGQILELAAGWHWAESESSRSAGSSGANFGLRPRPTNGHPTPQPDRLCQQGGSPLRASLHAADIGLLRSNTPSASSRSISRRNAGMSAAFIQTRPSIPQVSTFTDECVGELGSGSRPTSDRTSSPSPSQVSRERVLTIYTRRETPSPGHLTPQSPNQRPENITSSAGAI